MVPKRKTLPHTSLMQRMQMINQMLQLVNGEEEKGESVITSKDKDHKRPED